MHTLETWAEVMRAGGASEATIRIRTMAIRSLCTHSGVASPLEITRLHTVAFLGRPQAQWTRCTYWSSIRQWCRFLSEFDIAEVDLLKGIARPKQPAPVARPLHDEEVRRVLDMPKPPRADAFVRLAAYAALRCVEIARVRGEDLDVRAGWLRVTGKGGDEGFVPLHENLTKLAEFMPESGWWFPSRTDPTTHVAPRQVSLTIAGAMAEAGISGTAHRLRDSAATRIQRQVRDLRVTQSFLRHRSVVSTQKYTAVSDRDLASAAKVLAW